MHHRLVMVTARDLLRGSRIVVVGPETARVCDTAVTCFAKLEEAKLVITAGHSERFDVIMGAGPMRSYLVTKYEIAANQICTPIAKEFNTNGEMDSLAHLMREQLMTSPEDTFEIWLAASWWHLLRAWALLHARLEPWQRRQTKVHWVPAWSQPSSWKDKDWFTAFFGELLMIGFAKNIGNLLWWKHDLYACPKCKAPDSCEVMGNNSLCHRCKDFRSLA